MRPFRPFGVPPFAKFLFEAEVGAAGVPGESLIAQTWDGEFEDKCKAVIHSTFSLIFKTYVKHVLSLCIQI